LHLILAAMGVGPGDEVIVPAFTWVATANVVVYCGATPVFADVDRRTNNIDPADVARRLTPRTKAVVAVHLFGLCAEMDVLRAVVPKSHSNHRRCGLCSRG
jgi:perosamine synthetase